MFLWERSEFQDYRKLWGLVEEVSRAAWNYFNPDAPLLQKREGIPLTAQECEGNYLPPGPEYVKPGRYQCVAALRIRNCLRSRIENANQLVQLGQSKRLAGSIRWLRNVDDSAMTPRDFACLH